MADDDGGHIGIIFILDKLDLVGTFRAMFRQNPQGNVREIAITKNCLLTSLR